MSNYEKKERKSFKSYSKNLSAFIIEHGIKPIDSGAHYWGIRISEDYGKTWKDYVSIDKALEDYGNEFSKAELIEARDLSLKSDQSVTLADSEKYCFRKRIRFYKEFRYDDELIDCLKLWSETNPKGKKK